MPTAPPCDAPRVLVIDDNRDAADTLCLLLRTWGFDARAAYGAEEGLLAAHERRPHAVVCDLAMPGLSGFDVARRLRAAGGGAVPFLLALSAYGGRFVTRAEEAGFDHYLVKATDPEELRALLASACRAGAFAAA